MTEMKHASIVETFVQATVALVRGHVLRLTCLLM